MNRLFVMLLTVIALAAGCRPSEPAPSAFDADPAAGNIMPGAFVGQEAVPAQAAAEAVPSAPVNLTGVRNPFLLAEEQRGGDAGRLPAQGLSISAIFFEPGANSKAIINGKIVHAGDLIGDKEVVRIEPEKVILKDSRNEYSATIGEAR